jgi:hypothetical protein
MTGAAKNNLSSLWFWIDINRTILNCAIVGLILKKEYLLEEASSKTSDSVIIDYSDEQMA